jgi:hypothetical protein
MAKNVHEKYLVCGTCAKYMPIENEVRDLGWLSRFQKLRSCVA